MSINLPKSRENILLEKIDNFLHNFLSETVYKPYIKNYVGFLGISVSIHNDSIDFV